MKSVLMFVATLLLLCSSLFGQTQNLTGSQIPDGTAQRLWLLHVSNMDATTEATYLGNVLTNSNDVTTAQNVISAFANNYAQDVAQYNTAVKNDGSGFTQAILTTFQNQQTSLTAATWSVLQNNLTPDGFTSVTSNLAVAKNSMSVAVPGGTQMTCCFSTVSTVAAKISIIKGIGGLITVTYQSLTFSHTVEGNVGAGTIIPTGALHTQKINTNVTGHVYTTTGPAINPLQYATLSNSVVLSYTFANGVGDACIADDTGDDPCVDDTQLVVDCSVIGQAFSSGGVGGGTGFEIAKTMTIVTGVGQNCQVVTIGRTTSTYCHYPVNNWCTQSSTPPDFDMDGQTVYYSKVTAPGYFLVGTFCSRFNNSGPWTCFQPGLAFAAGNSQPLYSCTSNL